jgi:exodeoxyribonuclease V alpha subunit
VTAHVPAGESRGLLETLRERGAFSALDYHFARAMLGIAGETSADVAVCAALASRAVQQGHVCVDLLRLADSPPLDDNDEPMHDLAWPSPERLIAALQASRLADAEDPLAPLWLEAGRRLYLRRYAGYEAALAAELLRRALLLESVDAPALAQGLQRLFPAGGADAQRLAACVAVTRRLSVICGGPGTGKTTTVVKTLCLLQEQQQLRGARPLQILLLAPTGKAAQRLGEAVALGLAGLDVPQAIKDCVPLRAATIHRALGIRSQPASVPRHHRENPLSADVVLVDEVSMVDLALLYRLVDAVRPEARLILQGDKDQLVSVEAGAILGDLYPERAEVGYSLAFAEQLGSLTQLTLAPTHPEPGLHDCLITLSRSYRYAESSGIGQLARAINAGDARRALGVLKAASPSSAATDCRLIEPLGRDIAEGRLPRELAERAVAGYTRFIRAREPEEKLARLAEYRVLCSHRRGPYGVQALNRAIEGWLADAGLLRHAGDFYEHRPIIITQNDYTLDLMNGDVGIVLRTPEHLLRVCFMGSDGLRFLLPSRLPPHETVFATTVHKSQGSEFDAVSIVLPNVPSKLLVRELLYTAVTRARKQVDVFGRAELVASAIQRPIERASGLRQRLWPASR